MNNQNAIEPILNAAGLNLDKGAKNPNLGKNPDLGKINDFIPGNKLEPIGKIPPAEDIIHCGILGDFTVVSPVGKKITNGKVNLEWKSSKLSPALTIKDSKISELTFGDTFKIGFFTDDRVSKLEYNSNIAEFNDLLKSEALTRDDLRNLIEVINQRGYFYDKIRPGIIAQEVESWVKQNGHLRLPKITGFEVFVNKEGPGIVCKFSSFILDTSGKLNGIKHNGDNFTYTLSRTTQIPGIKEQLPVEKLPKAVEETASPQKKPVQLDVISQSDTPVFGFRILDENVNEGKTYKYTLAVTYGKNGDREIFTREITYTSQLPVIESFTAYSHSTEKKVAFITLVKNETSRTIKRKDLATPLGNVSSDTNVEEGGKYEYTLEASNYWGTVKETANVDCSNVLPSKADIEACVDDKEKKVTLTWRSSYNVATYTVQRREKGIGNFKDIITNDFKKLDCTFVDKDTSLIKGKEYEYRIINKNGWGSSASNTVSVLFDKPVPNAPRITCIQDNLRVHLTWDYQFNIKSYDLTRISDGQSLNPDTYFCNATDYSVAEGEQYTYKIIAKNEWGDSIPTYCSINIPKPVESQDCYKYRGNSIDEEEVDWADDFQGITTDGEHWYFTNGSGYGEISKFPINESIKKDLSSTIDESKTFTGHGIHYTIAYTPLIGSNGTKRRYPRRFYCENYHFGDCCYYKGYLFVPAYDSKKEIWIFDAGSLALLHREEIKKKDFMIFDSLGWCAINPSDGKLYTCDHTLTDTFDVDTSPIVRFKINLNNIGTSSPVFTRDGYIYLYTDEKCTTAFGPKKSMQGGCFDYYNNLYLNSGFYDSKREKEGIQVFRLICDSTKQLQEETEKEAYYIWEKKGRPIQSQEDQDRDYREASINVREKYNSKDLDIGFDCKKAVLISASGTNEFTYQVTHGDLVYYREDGEWKKTSTYAEEPEGIVYFDLTNSDVYHDKMKYSFHASLLDNDKTGDDIYLKTYEHKYRVTNGRTINFRPANAKISYDQNRQDFKLVDNCILVQRFTNETEAKNAQELFQEWGCNSNREYSYYVIGDLYTCSPEHNYEFKVWNGLSKINSESKYKLFDYNAKDCTCEYTVERWAVTVTSKDGKKKKVFYAHNESDGKAIYKYIKDHSEIYMIGSSTINNERNLIWFR